MSASHTTGLAHVRSFASVDELTQTAARDLVQAVARSSSSAKPFCIALSGGRIAAPLFAAIVSCAASSAVSWSTVHWFWADERCVPPHDAESNFKLAEASLFRPLAIPGPNIHRIRGEVEPAQAAADAAADLIRIAPETRDGLPILDLVWLGLGEDGHVASLFPAQTTEPAAAIYYPVVGPKPPPRRITLSYRMLATARAVWVLVSGESKRAALRASLHSDGTPLSRVLHGRPETVIYADWAATGSKES